MDVWGRPRRGVAATVTHRNNYTPSRSRNSQYSKTFIPLSVTLWNDLADPVFDGVGLAGFKSKDNDFLLLAKAARPFFIFYRFLFLFCLYMGLVLWAWGLHTDRVSIALSQPCIEEIF